MENEINSDSMELNRDASAGVDQRENENADVLYTRLLTNI